MYAHTMREAGSEAIVIRYEVHARPKCLRRAVLALFAATNVKFLLIPSGLATLVWTFAAGLLLGAFSFIAIAVCS